MKLPEIRRLVSTETLESLHAAEQALLNEQPLSIEVHGVDEGEQLTHVLGAIDVLTRVAEGTPLNTALREFTDRVRQSIEQ